MKKHGKNVAKTLCFLLAAALLLHFGGARVRRIPALEDLRERIASMIRRDA